MNLQENIKKEFDAAKDKVQFLNDLRKYISSLSPEKVNPVDCVLWVDKDMVVANNYNPNHVADKEMRLLYTSVREDGYTMPIVTIWDEKLQKYVIIDGFHRNLVIRKFADINERCGGKLPIVGVGGIMSPEQAKEMLAAGASLIEIYSGFIYEGPGFVEKILKSLDTK